VDAYSHLHSIDGKPERRLNRAATWMATNTPRTLTSSIRSRSSSPPRDTIGQKAEKGARRPGSNSANKYLSIGGDTIVLSISRLACDVLLPANLLEALIVSLDERRGGVQ
jgi:hypothetical protein